MRAYLLFLLFAVVVVAVCSSNNASKGVESPLTLLFLIHLSISPCLQVTVLVAGSGCGDVATAAAAQRPTRAFDGRLGGGDRRASRGNVAVAEQGSEDGNFLFKKLENIRAIFLSKIHR